jgi:hypothetical protein
MGRASWYARHGVSLWTEGGGPDGVLVWSTENVDSGGIGAQAIEKPARDVLY